MEASGTQVFCKDGAQGQRGSEKVPPARRQSSSEVVQTSSSVAHEGGGESMTVHWGWPACRGRQGRDGNHRPVSADEQKAVKS